MCLFKRILYRVFDILGWKSYFNLAWFILVLVLRIDMVFWVVFDVLKMINLVRLLCNLFFFFLIGLVLGVGIFLIFVFMKLGLFFGFLLKVWSFCFSGLILIILIYFRDNFFCLILKVLFLVFFLFEFLVVVMFILLMIIV